jgi:hypothetical protein
MVHARSGTPGAGGLPGPDTVVKVTYRDQDGRGHPAARRDLFPLGTAISLADLDHDPFDVRRRGARLNLAFAHGPHFCLGAHLARLEAQASVRAMLTLPGLRLDPGHPAAPRGLVFRKPPELRVLWAA